MTRPAERPDRWNRAQNRHPDRQGEEQEPGRVAVDEPRMFLLAKQAKEEGIQLSSPNLARQRARHSFAKVEVTRHVGQEPRRVVIRQHGRGAGRREARTPTSAGPRTPGPPTLRRG